MWLYAQSTGQLTNAAGENCARGYSGNPACRNDPAAQARHNQGPLPRGLYKIGVPVDREIEGPYVLPLAPSYDNHMFGRSGFLIHGDKIGDPGNGSEGCIVLDRQAREAIVASGDLLLEVIV